MNKKLSNIALNDANEVFRAIAERQTLAEFTDKYYEEEEAKMHKAAHLFVLIGPHGIKKFRIMSDRNPTILQQDTCWAHIFTTSGETFEKAHKNAKDIIARNYSWIKTE